MEGWLEGQVVVKLGGLWKLGLGKVRVKWKEWWQEGEGEMQIGGGRAAVGGLHVKEQEHR